jgi:tRNA nucleotidyltransferase (CCA-adding enzyme)
LFNSVKKVLSWHDLLFLEEPYMKWAVYFIALTGHCDEMTVEDICKRMEIAPRFRTIFSKERSEADSCLSLLERNRSMTNSDLYHQLSGFKTELVLYMMATTKNKNVKRYISNYYTILRNVDISTKGRDLIEMGIQPGPIFREILQAVHDAKINGQLKTRKDELVFVKDYVR